MYLSGHVPLEDALLAWAADCTTSKICILLKKTELCYAEDMHRCADVQVGLRLRQKDSSSRRICAKWLRIQPPDGQAVRFNVEEDSRKSSDWQGPFLASATNCALCIVQAYHANMKAA